MQKFWLLKKQVSPNVWAVVEDFSDEAQATVALQVRQLFDDEGTYKVFFDLWNGETPIFRDRKFVASTYATA